VKFEVGDKVLRKDRPEGHDVPGTVHMIDRLRKRVWIEIRPGKCVPYTYELAEHALEIVK